MKSFKIILAAVVIFLASNALSGCSTNDTSNTSMSELGMARIDAALELKKSAEITLKEISRTQNEVKLQLILNNPEAKPITSVESWLSFNPDFLKGVTFDSNENFELMAPYLNGFDHEKGLFMFGRSSAEAMTDRMLVLAELTLEIKQKGLATIEAYDYQDNLDGHQSVNIMLDDQPVNILLKPESPLYMINN